MLTALFVILMISFIGIVIRLALKMAWGITKLVFGVILFPIFIIGMVLAGLMSIALPVLVAAGIILLILAALN